MTSTGATQLENTCDQEQRRLGQARAAVKKALRLVRADLAATRFHLEWALLNIDMAYKKRKTPRPRGR
jgi:hypothetical protein